MGESVLSFASFFPMLQHAQHQTQTIPARLQKSYLPGLLFLINGGMPEFSPAQGERGGKFFIGIKRRKRGISDLYRDAGLFKFLRNRAPRILARTLAHYGIGVARIGQPAALA